MWWSASGVIVKAWPSPCWTGTAAGAAPVWPARAMVPPLDWVTLMKPPTVAGQTALRIVWLLVSAT